jgi:angiopoietin 2
MAKYWILLLGIVTVYLQAVYGSPIRDYSRQRRSTDSGVCASYPCLNGGTCVAGDDGFTCSCAAGYHGDNCQTRKIFVQQHVGGTAAFQRTWAEFKAGFGAEDGDYWIGNDRLHELTANGGFKMRFDVQSKNNDQWYWAEYTTFTVGDEASGYVLQIGGYSGNAFDAMNGNELTQRNLNGMKFSTKDRDNDKRSSQNCADRDQTKGGFWHNDCLHARVTGSDGTTNGFSWDGLPDGGTGTNNLKYSKMTLIEVEE